MAEILVLAEHTGGEVKKVTCELITLARRFGEPAVVWTGPGAEEGQPRCAEFGAARVYVAADAAFDDYVVAPTAALLAQLVTEKAPSLVLVAGTPEGKEVAGRLARDRLERLLQPRPGSGRRDPAGPGNARVVPRLALGGRRDVGLVLAGPGHIGLRARDKRTRASGVTGHPDGCVECGDLAASDYSRASLPLLSARSEWRKPERIHCY